MTSRLIFADGTERHSNAIGRRVVSPVQIVRGDYREIADRILEPDDVVGGVIVYRESYWEVPRKHCDECSNPGMHYYPKGET